MAIGYACLNIGTPNTNIRSVMQRNATAEKLTEVITHNLEALEKMVDYNIANGIRLYRISSDLIPFGSSPVNTLAWPEIHKEAFDRIGSKIRKSGMRVSLHPGQYTMMNSPTEDVVARAIEDLNYHDKILTALGADQTNRIVLHVGGSNGDKAAAMDRFAANFQRLPEIVQNLMQLAPTTHFVSLGQAILFRGAGIETVWPPFLALLVIGTALFVLSLRRFRNTISQMA